MFWNTTPWQLGQLLIANKNKKEEQHNSAAWMMWHGALLPKLKTHPPLSDFICGKKPIKTIDEDAILARLSAYQRRVESECQS